MSLLPFLRLQIACVGCTVNHNTELNALALLEKSKKPFPLFHSEIAGL